MTGNDLLPRQLAELTGARPEPVALAAWSCSVSNGSLHHVGVRLDGDALELVAGPLAKPSAWRLLLANSGLRPPARLVISPLDEVLLRSEVLLDGAALDSRILDSAIRSLREGLDAAEDASSPAWARAEPWDVAQGLTDAGLAGRLLADGRFRVDPAGAGLRGLMIGPEPAARVEMLAPGEYPAAVREAVATLLLRTTASVRFVRAAAEESGAARLEVVFPAAPAAEELQMAVAALALAGRCAEEIAVLTCEDVAALYLAISGNPQTKGGDRICQSLQPM